jgi:hypothetical protein
MLCWFTLLTKMFTLTLHSLEDQSNNVQNVLKQEVVNTENSPMDLDEKFSVVCNECNHVICTPQDLEMATTARTASRTRSKETQTLEDPLSSMQTLFRCSASEET